MQVLIKEKKGWNSGFLNNFLLGPDLAENNFIPTGL